MKTVVGLAALMSLLSVSVGAQTRIAGTWRVDGEGASLPWTVVLKVDGPKLTGQASQCANNRAEIFDGRVEGDRVTFKCQNVTGERTVLFTGVLNDEDELILNWHVQIAEKGSPVSPANRMFGPLAPATVVAKRVPESDTVAVVSPVRGVDLAASVNLFQKDMKVEGSLFVPQRVKRVRSLIVATGWGRGFDFYFDQKVRSLLEVTDSALVLARLTTISNARPNSAVLRAEAGGAEGLALVLKQLAKESGHDEVADAPILFWGHSGGAQFGPSYAVLFPHKTIAFVGYQGMAVREADTDVVSRIPALFFIEEPTLQFVLGNNGSNAWKAARSRGAAWTFAVEPGVKHGDMEGLRKGNDLLIPWMHAVLQQRVPREGRALNVVTDKTGWLANNRTGEIAPTGTFTGATLEASWHPDEMSARGWRVVTGFSKQ